MAARARPAPHDHESATLEELALARILEECLEAMERGETDLEALAGRHPHAKQEVLPLLEIAQHLRERRAAGGVLSLQFREELRARLMSHRVAR